MLEVIQNLQANALLFGLMLVRVSALFATAPFLNSRAIPVRIKAGFAVLLVFIALPLTADTSGPLPDSTVGFVTLALKELIVGAAMGLLAQMLFAAVQLAGSYIDLSAGFAIASTIDPSSNMNLTVLGRVYNMVLTAAFLAIGGHLLLVGSVVRSFELIRPTQMPRFEFLVQGVIARSDEMFVISLQLAAPLMAALLITDVALGIMSRAAPQMNVFIVGMPVKIGIALIGTAILLPTFVTLFDGYTQQMFSDMSRMLVAAGG